MQNKTSWKPLFDRLADAAGTAILPYFRQQMAVENKLVGAFDPVTEGDKGAERAIRAILDAELPDHGILGEEYGAKNLDAEHVWVLDPIDGTRAFISGLPTWGTLIGLKQHGKAIAGMMAQPFTGERYFGDGVSAHYDGPGGARPIKTRDVRNLAEATLMTTSPRIMKDKITAYNRVEKEVRLARYGCDCYAMAMVAAGCVDIVIEAGLQPYDIVALIPLIEGAGGVITNWQGGRVEDGGDVVMAGTAQLHEAALKLLNA